MDNKQLISEILKQIKQPLWENWYIQEQIGAGAYSSVYKVTAKRMNRTDVSALKIEPIVPDPSAASDEAKKKRSIEEKRSLAVNESTIMYNLKSCPNIVSYEDEDIRELIIDGKLEGYYFLIRMEYLSCLSDLLKKREFQLTEKNILRLACDIGRGIKAAHDVGIIHRDLKPGNFFIDSKGVYKLGDFNISKQSGTSKAFAGTNGYLAPEVFSAKSGSGESYTCQADVYSFGICLYQLMNDLYMPFEGEMPFKAAVDKRMTGAALPPPRRASQEFSRIILRACAFDRNQRYATIDDMLRDLDTLENPEPTPVQPEPQPVVQVQQPFQQSFPQQSYPPQQQFPEPQQMQTRQESSFTPLPVIAAVFALAIIGVSVFICIKLFNGDDSKKTVSSDTTSVTQAAEVPITDISLSSSDVTINIYEDVNIKSVDCPDVIHVDQIAEMFGYSYDVDVCATNEDIAVTVNEGATETISVDAPQYIEVMAKYVGNVYYLTIDASKAAGSDKDCTLIVHNSDNSIQKKISVKILNTGPFRDSLRRVSDNPEVIEFNDDDTFSVHSTGEATVSWVYNGEVKYSKKISIEE